MFKIKRNDTCPCGSGIKYKKCCLADPEKTSEILHACSVARTYDEISLIINKPMNVYQLKVELIRMGLEEIEAEVSRVFIIEGNETLYDFHILIQDAFNWDNDHMFSFYLSEELFDRNNEYSANPLGEHTPPNFSIPSKSAATAQLRDIKLKTNYSFWYLFDYGDELVHKITVEEVREKTSKDWNLPKLIDKIGIVPSQYGEYDG